MTPIEAITNLYNLSALAPVPKQTHAQAQEWYQIAIQGAQPVESKQKGKTKE